MERSSNTLLKDMGLAGTLMMLPVLAFACAASDNDPGTGDDEDTEANDTEDTGEPKEILPNCDNCRGIGDNLENLRCAIELCDDNVLSKQNYTSPTIVNATKLNQSRSAVAHFGNLDNDLAPLMGDSYALMSSGIAKGTNHNTTLNRSTLLNPEGKSVNDPFSPNDEYEAYDVVEWRLHLKAPSNAKGFQIHYVFFSVEYDEYIGKEFNDKFYIFLEAGSTNGGERTVINYTECRDPNAYSDFTCTDKMANAGICKRDEKYCYIAINTALSECCWYNDCAGSPIDRTDISGTGFSCGTADEDHIGAYSMGYTFGSSTGWLYTQWPIEPGEEFDIVFHIHDTADSNLDSEVILDKFLFVTEATPETGPVVK